MNFLFKPLWLLTALFLTASSVTAAETNGAATRHTEPAQSTRVAPPSAFRQFQQFRGITTAEPKTRQTARSRLRLPHTAKPTAAKISAVEPPRADRRMRLVIADEPLLADDDTKTIEPHLTESPVDINALTLMPPPAAASETSNAKRATEKYEGAREHVASDTPIEDTADAKNAEVATENTSRSSPYCQATGTNIEFDGGHRLPRPPRKMADVLTHASDTTAGLFRKPLTRKQTAAADIPASRDWELQFRDRHGSTRPTRDGVAQVNWAAPILARPSRSRPNRTAQDDQPRDRLEELFAGTSRESATVKSARVPMERNLPKQHGRVDEDYDYDQFLDDEEIVPTIPTKRKRNYAHTLGSVLNDKKEATRSAERQFAEHIWQQAGGHELTALQRLRRDRDRDRETALGAR